MSEWAGLPHDGPASELRDVLRKQPRALDVEDDLGPRTARQHVARKEHHLPVRPDDGPLAVDHAETIPVPVEREPHIRLVPAHRCDQILQVRGHARVGVVVRKIAVDLAMELHHVVPERPEQSRCDVSRHAVAAVDDDPSGFVTGHGRDLPANAPNVVPDDLRASQRSLRANVRPGAAIVRLDPASEILDGVAMQRLAGQHDLQPVVLRRVVAAGDHDAAAGPEMLRCKVEHGSRHPADVDHVPAALAQPLDERRLQLGARVPTVAAHDQGPHASMARLGADGTADPPDDLRGQGVADDAPDVVGPEDSSGKPARVLDGHASSPAGSGTGCPAPTHPCSVIAPTVQNRLMFNGFPLSRE